MILKLAVKNVVSRKSSFVIILFMSFAVCLFCIANAVFDSTEQGVQTTFVTSFTGNVVIRSQSKNQLSLFGDETPVTGELTEIESLVPYPDICDFLKSNRLVKAFTPQVSCMTAMEFGSQRLATYVFGVNGDEYLSVMESARVIEGEPFVAGQKGMMLCDRTAARLGVKVGDTVQFTVADGPNFRIRAAPVTAIFTYEIYNDIFERFVLVDGDTVRSLLNMDSGAVVEDIQIDEDAMNLLEIDLDLDSLFDDAFDTDAIWDLFEDEEVEEVFESVPDFETLESSYVVSNSWNYLILRLNPGVDANTAIKKLNSAFRKKGWPVEATDWRHAAGSTALYLYWMRIIFNIGIAVVLFAGFIIVNNTLVVNVLDRTQEIGTLRAIGTKKTFIALECMAETFFMTLLSGVFGVVLGKICCHFITKAHIVFHNSFLIQLFGGEALNVVVTGGNIAKMFLLVIVLGFVGWIYPVINAVKISPVRAMQGGRQ